MMYYVMFYVFFFFKQKTAYEMCGRDWSSDVCSSDLASPISAALSDRNRRRLGQLVEIHQGFDKRGHLIEVDHVRAVAGRIVRVLVRFHENRADANGGSRAGRSESTM